MNKRALPEWANDIPMMDPETRAMSERAVHQQWTNQLQRQAAERNRWRQALAPNPSRNNYTVRGPYRRRRRGGRYVSGALACAVLLGVLLGLAGLGGCSLASDSQVDEMVALDLQDAITTAQKATPHQSPANPME